MLLRFSVRLLVPVIVPPTVSNLVVRLLIAMLAAPRVTGAVPVFQRAPAVEAKVRSAFKTQLVTPVVVSVPEEGISEKLPPLTVTVPAPNGWLF